MFKYNGKKRNLIRAVDIANRMLIDDIFYLKIKRQHIYDDSNATGTVVCRLIKNHRSDVITIIEVTPKWKYSKMMAVFSSKRPSEIGINYRILKRATTESLVGTIMHENIHAVDNRETDYRFGHGSNSSKGKALTVPYYVGKMAKKHCQEFYHKSPLRKKRKWYNPKTWF